MEKIDELNHGKSFDELKPGLIKEIESLKNQYNKEILLYSINFILDDENGTLIIRCDKYNINWYIVFLEGITQIYEEAPVIIEPFISVYRDKFMSNVNNALLKIIVEACPKRVKQK